MITYKKIILKVHIIIFLIIIIDQSPDMNEDSKIKINLLENDE